MSKFYRSSRNNSVNRAHNKTSLRIRTYERSESETGRFGSEAKRPAISEPTTRMHDQVDSGHNDCDQDDLRNHSGHFNFIGNKLLAQL